MTQVTNIAGRVEDGKLAALAIVARPHLPGATWCPNDAKRAFRHCYLALVLVVSRVPFPSAKPPQ
eukprot:4414870-Amphidinium_carterae.1